jgi:hypothetical protein
VKAEHRYSPPVDDRGIELTIRVRVGNHLTATRKADRRAVVLPVVVLELLAVAAARWIALDPAHEARFGLPQAAPHLDVIAAGKIELRVVQPPWHVDVHAADAILVMRNMINHRRDEPGDVGPRGVGQVLPDRTAAVGETLRKMGGRRVEENPRRLTRARRQHNDAGADVAVLASRLVDV